MNQGAQTGAASPPSARVADEAQMLAGDLAAGARDAGLGLVEQQKAAAAEQVEGVARAIEEVAGEVERGIPVVAPYLREAASQIHRVSSTLRARSTDDLLQDFGEFARRRPAALLGASLLAGFALARFLKSSADRRASRGLRSPAQAQTSRSSDRTSAGPTSGNQPSEADLAGARSPAAGMASLSDVAPGAGAPKGTSTVGTSAAGGGSEAPEPRTVGSI